MIPLTILLSLAIVGLVWAVVVGLAWALVYGAEKIERGNR